MWIAVAVYVLVAIVRKRLNLEFSLHSMLQILSVTPIEKRRCSVACGHGASGASPTGLNQLILL